MTSDDDGRYYSHRAVQEQKQKQDSQEKLHRSTLDALAGEYAQLLASRTPVSKFTLQQTNNALTAQWAEAVAQTMDCKRLHDETRSYWLKRLHELDLKSAGAAGEIRRLSDQMADHDNGELVTDGIRLVLMRLRDLCSHYQDLQRRRLP